MKNTRRCGFTSGFTPEIVHLLLLLSHSERYDLRVQCYPSAGVRYALKELWILTSCVRSIWQVDKRLRMPLSSI